jgi:hypothetical protein
MDGVQIAECHIETDRRWRCLYGRLNGMNKTRTWPFSCYIVTQIILNTFRMFQYIYIIRNNVTRFGFIFRVLPQLGVRVRQYVAQDVLVLSWRGVHIRHSILLTSHWGAADRAGRQRAFRRRRYDRTAVMCTDAGGCLHGVGFWRDRPSLLPPWSCAQINRAFEDVPR